MLNMSGLDQLLLKEGAANATRTEDSLYSLIDLAKSVEILRKDIRNNGAANLHSKSFRLYLKTLAKKFMN